MTGGEDIERAALQSLHDAADASMRSALGLAVRDVGGALVSTAGRLPASAIVVNRALGLGMTAPATGAHVASIVETYRRAGVARYFVHVHPDAKPLDLARRLAGAGLAKARAWVKFERGAEPPPDAATDLRVARIGRAEGPDFGRIAADAFDLGPAAVPWLARLPDAPGWHVFMSFEGETPAGVGALYVQGRTGWCDWGATAPAFRRRGSQGALLRQRVVEAIRLGCTSIWTGTGEEVAGQPQHSWRNIGRMGFRERYVRDNWAPPRP